MTEFLLSLVTDFAGPIVDLFISSLGWNKAEQTNLQILKKELLRTLTITIEYLRTMPATTQMRIEIIERWNDLAVDFEPYNHLCQRINEFARAIESSSEWNANQRTALAIRLNAFRASIQNTNIKDLKGIGTKRSKKTRKAGKKPYPKQKSQRAVSLTARKRICHAH